MSRVRPIPIFLFALLSACRREAPKSEESLPEEAPPVNEEVPELPEPGLRGQSHCRPVGGAPYQFQAVSPGGSEREDVQAGAAIVWNGRFAVPSLGGGGSDRASALSLGFDGSARELALGDGRGLLEPPELAAAGEALIAVAPSTDAGGRTLRTFRWDPGTSSWANGPEVSEGGDESEAFSVAVSEGTAGVVWDEQRSGQARSKVLFWPLDAVSLKEKARPRPVSPLGDDAGAPRLVGRSGGYWLAWLAYETKAKARPDALVEEESSDISARLRVARLRPNGLLDGEPLDVTEALAGLDFQMTRLGDTALLTAWHGPEAPLAVLFVDASGSIRRVELAGAELDRSPPTAMSLSETEALLSARARDGATLLARVSANRQPVWEAEPALLGRDVLGASADRVVALRTLEGRVQIELISCSPGDTARQ